MWMISWNVAKWFWNASFTDLIMNKTEIGANRNSIRKRNDNVNNQHQRIFPVHISNQTNKTWSAATSMGKWLKFSHGKSLT